MVKEAVIMIIQLPDANNWIILAKENVKKQANNPSSKLSLQIRCLLPGMSEAMSDRAQKIQ